MYRHRVNSIDELLRLPDGQGIELDLRSSGDRVLVTHDPFTEGPTIQEYFPLIGTRPCIFNVKCEGIEAAVLAAARSAGVEDFFFLDLSVPAAVKLLRRGERRLAVRWSEVEPIEAVLAWEGRVDWVWADCFQHFPGTPAEWERLQHAFRVCVVSPELQGHDDATREKLRQSLIGRPFAAVCTKRPEEWVDQP